MLRFLVIGINDNPQPTFTDEVKRVIDGGKVFPSGQSFCFRRFYVQADSALTQMSPEQSSFHRIIIETSIVEYKQIFSFVFSVDLINRFEFFNCNSVVSNRSGNGYSRHSVSIHFSCNVHMNPSHPGSSFHYLT